MFRLLQTVLDVIQCLLRIKSVISRDDVVVRASASQSVDPGFIF